MSRPDEVTTRVLRSCWNTEQRASLQTIQCDKNSTLNVSVSIALFPRLRIVYFRSNTFYIVPSVYLQRGRGLCNSVRGVKITFCMKRLRSEDTGHWTLGFLNLDIDTVMFSQSFEEAPLGTLINISILGGWRQLV